MIVFLFVGIAMASLFWGMAYMRKSNVARVAMESVLAHKDRADALEASGNVADATIAELRSQLSHARAAVYQIVGDRGKIVEHEGGKPGVVSRGRILLAYEDCGKWYWFVKPIGGGRPPMPYGIPRDQCTVIEGEG